MVRQIINIDEDKCDGCGVCQDGCPEGAIRIIDDKAKLVGEILCDGLGACIGSCPQGAIIVEKREAEPYDEKKVMENIVKQGEKVLKAHLEHLLNHEQFEYLRVANKYMSEHSIENPIIKDMAPLIGNKKQDSTIARIPTHGHRGGCPGSQMMDFSKEKEKPSTAPYDSSTPIKSELNQWPIQLKLINPSAPYFQNADLLISADCVAFANGDFHRKLLKGRRLIILCPKLDDGIDGYIEKLTRLFSENNIRSISIAHMEVPCCSGVGRIVKTAIVKSGKDILVNDYTIKIHGDIEYNGIL